MNNQEHLNFVRDMVNFYKDRFGSDDLSVFSDLICDLGHYADTKSVDYLHQVKNGVSHWVVEKKDAISLSTFLNTDVKIDVSDSYKQLEDA